MLPLKQRKFGHMSAAAHPSRRITWLSVLALVGLASSIWLSHLYYSVRGGMGGFRSFCNIGATMNCDAVAASPWAEIFPGVPLSSLAAGGFLAIFAATIAARIPGWRRESLRFLFLLSLVSALFTFGYLGIMMLQLKTLCLFCLVIDGVTLASLAILLGLKPESPRKAPVDGSQWKTLIAVGGGALLVAVVLLKGMDQTEIPAATLEEVAQSVVSSPVVTLGPGAEGSAFGNPKAPITIVKFSDLQCPACRMGAVLLNSIVNRYPDQVRVVYRNFPLDPSCNRKIERSMHPVACEAARVALCAASEGRFKETYERIFEFQADLRPGKALELAREAGADESRITSCVATPGTAELIARDIDEGIALGVQSTPTFFINGHRVEGVYPLPVWNRIIELLLAQSGK